MSVSYEFSGINKSGKKVTETASGATERECRSQVTKKFRTITSVVRVAEVIGGDDQKVA
jgi:hypothetical protein